MLDWQHGRSGWVNHGCRCGVCHRALLRYERVRRAAEVLARGGEPQSRNRPGRARRKVDELLAAGWSQADIVRATGLACSTISRIATRRTRHVSLVTERALLAIEP